MSAPVQEEVDDRDEDIPRLDPAASDVERLVWLLETCRKRGYQLGPHVQIGTVVANVVDLRLAKREGMIEGSANPPRRDRGIWAEHGHDPDADEPAEGTAGR